MDFAGRSFQWKRPLLHFEADALVISKAHWCEETEREAAIFHDIARSEERWPWKGFRREFDFPEKNLETRDTSLAITWYRIADIEGKVYGSAESQRGAQNLQTEVKLERTEDASTRT